MVGERGRPAGPGGPRRLAAAATAVLLTAGAVGCGTDESTADGRSDRVGHDSRRGEKTGTGEVRSDLRPLTKRFDLLGAPRQATWMSGTLGSSKVPGPTSYWIDAVVTLAPGDAAELEQRYAAAPTDQRPDVIDDLTSELPKGQLLASERLDEAFSESGFATRVYVAVGSNQVVLTAKGQ